MRCVIACGGTGGHFYPGYALGKELKARGSEVLFLLRENDPAGPRLEADGFPFVELPLSGLKRTPGLSWLAAPAQALKAQGALRRLFRAYRPAVFAGMGSYVTGAAAPAAFLSGVPIILHESNAVLGLANRLMAPFADAVALGLPLRESLRNESRFFLTGTPIRPELHARALKESCRRSLGLAEAETILVLGGSQGARALNSLVPEGIARFALCSGRRLQVLHLCGKNRLSETEAAYRPHRSTLGTVLIREFTEEIGVLYGAADAAICRGGASTAAELLAQGLPALIVPYPYATDNHQNANAEALRAAGVAAIILEKDLAPDSLAAALAELPRQIHDFPHARIGLPAAAQSVLKLVSVVEAAAKKVA